MFQHVSCCDGNWCEMYAVSWGVILSIECSEPPSLTADQEAWNQFSFFSKPHASYPYCYQRGDIIIIISQTVLNARAQSATPRLLKFSGQLFSRAEHSIALVVRDILVAHWTVYSGLSHKSGPCNRASSVQNLRSRGRSFYTCRLAERDNFLNFMQFSAAGISSVSRFFQRTCRHRVDKYLFGQNGLTIGLLQTSLPR